MILLKKNKLKNKATKKVKLYEVFEKDRTTFKSGNLFKRRTLFK